MTLNVHNAANEHIHILQYPNTFAARCTCIVNICVCCGCGRDVVIVAVGVSNHSTMDRKNLAPCGARVSNRTCFTKNGLTSNVAMQNFHRLFLLSRLRLFFAHFPNYLKSYIIWIYASVGHTIKWKLKYNISAYPPFSQ